MNEYEAMFGIVINSARILDIVPMQEMLDTVNRADSVGPILDLTAYMKGMKNLPPQRRVLEAAIAFHKAVKEAAIEQ